MKLECRQLLDYYNQYTMNLRNVFTGIGCFKGMFSLQVQDGAKPYQAAPRCIMYMLQQPLKEILSIRKTSTYSTTRCT